MTSIRNNNVEKINIQCTYDENIRSNRIKWNILKYHICSLDLNSNSKDIIKSLQLELEMYAMNLNHIQYLFNSEYIENMIRFILNSIDLLSPRTCLISRKTIIKIVLIYYVIHAHKHIPTPTFNRSFSHINTHKYIIDDAFFMNLVHIMMSITYTHIECRSS